MEAPGCLRRRLPVLLLWVNGLVMLGFTGARQQTNLCNESLMLEKLPACGKSFEEMMKKVDSKKWCNLTEFIMYYDNFTQCTEREANDANCFWPNPLAEGFITGIHKQFFSNCTSEKVHWEDPPDEILITLILIPVMLTCAMITLVVWCSKRSDILVTLEAFICEPCDLDRRSLAKELNVDVTRWQLFPEASQEHRYQGLEVLFWQRNNLCVQ